MRLAASVALLTLVAVAWALRSAHAPPGWGALFATALVTSWLIPAPPLATSLAASLALGPARGADLAVYGLWVSSTMGYLASRLFPRAAVSVAGQLPPRLDRWLGRRDFGGVLVALLDPRQSFRARVAALGLFWTPFPWFALSCWVVYPSLAWTLCRWAPSALPDAWLQAVASRAEWLAAAILVWTAASSLRARRPAPSDPVPRAGQIKQEVSRHAA
jgi:uncharacterized membrane protein YdjX (TVP38/TMEM64 family)